MYKSRWIIWHCSAPFAPTRTFATKSEQFVVKRSGLQQNPCLGVSWDEWDRGHFCGTGKFFWKAPTPLILLLSNGHAGFGLVNCYASADSFFGSSAVQKLPKSLSMKRIEVSPQRSKRSPKRETVTFSSSWNPPLRGHWLLFPSTDGLKIVDGWSLSAYS